MANITSEETISRIFTSEKKANLIRGIINTSMSLGLDPEEAGRIFANLDDKTAGG